MIFNYNLSIVLLVSAQTVPRTINEQNPSNTTDITLSTTDKSNINTTLKPIQRSQQQTKSFKFTLVAGKFWRFDIKANSFSTYKGGELRLHKNVSVNNYTIDDDGWFQYNHQQQQLFAWPSLSTKPGTYNYVLLPSKIDLEEENENMINIEVVASIIVELIRPLYPANKSDIDQLVDHKFSLNDLRRHPSYLLLLQQMVSVFEFIGTRSQNSTQNSTTSLFATSTGSVSSHQKNKLNEYLLIGSNYSQDGESFSLTWSTHPSLLSNITQISKCRLSVIRDTVAKLSSLANVQHREDEKFVFYYSIAASSLNSQAIVPDLRGNTLLKLILNSPCQNETIVEELGLTSHKKFSDSLGWDADDKENSIIPIQATSKVISTTFLPGLPTPEAVNSNTAQQSQINSTPQTSTPTISTNNPQNSLLVTTSKTNQTSVTEASISAQTNSPALVNPSAPNTTVVPTNLLVTTTTIVMPETTLDGRIVNITPIRDIIRESPIEPTKASTNSTADRTPLVTKATKIEGLFVPQPKSFAEFFDSSDKQQQNPTLFGKTLTHEVTKPLDSSINSQSVSVVSTMNPNLVTESTLNEDLIGIIDDIMNYLTSVAVPVSIVIGAILLLSILIAVWSLCVKRRQSKEFQVRNRFDFRYGSERRVFLKNSSKPVILDVDQKSLSMGGTPQHKSGKKTSKNKKGDYFHLTPFDPMRNEHINGEHTATSFTEINTDAELGDPGNRNLGEGAGGH